MPLPPYRSPVIGAVVDQLVLTNQSAPIPVTNFDNANVAGNFRLGFYLACTIGEGSAGIVRFNIFFNDGVAIRTLTSLQVSLGLALDKTCKFTDVNLDGSFLKLGSGSISYSVTHTGGSIGNARYALWATLECLSPLA